MHQSRRLLLTFFTDTVFHHLVSHTNDYAQKKLTSTQLTTFALYRNWRPVTKDEMKGFIAVILNMGIIQMTDIKDYWSTDDTTNLPFFRSVFTRDRFLQIFGALHVGEIDSRETRSNRFLISSAPPSKQCTLQVPR